MICAQAYAQQTWHLALGPMIETTKLINADRQRFDNTQFQIPLKVSLGMILSSGWDKGCFGTRLSIAVKTNKVSLSHNLRYADANDIGEFENNIFVSESFLAIEPLLLAGFNRSFQKGGSLFVGGGGGFSFNSKNLTGSGNSGRSSLPNPVEYGYGVEGTEEFEKSLIPIVAFRLEYFQPSRNKRLGFTFGIENKWSILPLLKSSRHYTAELTYGTTQIQYNAYWKGNIANVSFYTTLRLNFTKHNND